ncbi:glyceraldehyde-3-phosphate dehydrogenase-like protein [Cubamyces sp. BRFM 1775]|nr:glyceraldehyde-3-phosphate dehydrogenase-like protein [Cubamyces sp. BRFM 1775]
MSIQVRYGMPQTHGFKHEGNCMRHISPITRLSRLHKSKCNRPVKLGLVVATNLDGCNQTCTKRDEFSNASLEEPGSRIDRAHVRGLERYQEMIAHLPLASHPNPKKVLVIGGGDSGIVREVLKHDTVEQHFLPHMSFLLNDPCVTVFVGDGFKFLADNTSTYDVLSPAPPTLAHPPPPLSSRSRSLSSSATRSPPAATSPPRESACVCHTLKRAEAIVEHDLAITLVSYIHHTNIIKAVIKGKTNVVTTSYISPAIRELEEDIKKAGIGVVNEIGLDPDVDHLYAIKTIDEVHATGEKVPLVLRWAPRSQVLPLGYKFSWSPRGGLLALLNSAAYLAESKQVDIQGKDLMNTARPYYITPAFAFVAYPNRNSVPFREFYNIPEAETVIRGTLRYQGFPEFVKALVSLGWLNLEKKEWLKDGLTWAQIMQQAIGASDASERSSASSPARRKVSVSSPASNGSAATVRDGNLLETLMKYEPGSRDLVMLEHKFVVEWGDSTTGTIKSTATQRWRSILYQCCMLYTNVDEIPLEFSERGPALRSETRGGSFHAERFQPFDRPSFAHLLYCRLPRYTSNSQTPHRRSDMPPPPHIAAALQLLLDQVPQMEEKFFKKAYEEHEYIVSSDDGPQAELKGTGLSRVHPENMGYTISLEYIVPDLIYQVWLEEPSEDIERNRRAFANALDYLINKAGNATRSHTVNVAQLA